MTMRSNLGRVRGLGSAREGTTHWWTMRLSSIALIPLTLWFAFSVATMAGASHGEFVEWVRNPLVAVLLVLFVTIGCRHSQQGIQVVIEDYVHTDVMKFSLLILSAGAHLIAGLVGAVSVLLILFQG